jgi:hypothetical protein
VVIELFKENNKWNMKIKKLKLPIRLYQMNEKKSKEQMYAKICKEKITKVQIMDV